MNKTPFPAQKFTTTHHPNNHRGSSARAAMSNTAKHHHPDPPASGQVTFRLLCHVNTAGGVIGNSGSIIKHLQTLTGSKIQFEDDLPNCHERVINVVGDACVEKKIKISIDEGKEEMVDVSKAQEGLIRVFERVLELGRNSVNKASEDSNIVCRLLASRSQIGAVMGTGGKIVDGIRKSSGAKIRVLKKEHIPVCAGPEEELIQIVGGVMAVKKALLAVSRRLQDRILKEGARTHMLSQDSVGHSLSGKVERMLNLNEDSSMRKVVFRFLCSNAIAGGMMGKRANIIKSLEKEIGASIKFASPVSGSKERVAIISSLEKSDPLYSPAQTAIIRVFARSIEAGLGRGVISSLDKSQVVTARILVASSQVGCLRDEDGRVASNISSALGVEIKLMGVDLRANCAGTDDDVIQITGEYENVKSALFQVTGKLRETFFSGRGPEGPDRHYSCPAIPSTTREAASSTQLSQLSRLSHIDQLDHQLGLVQKSSSPHSPVLERDQADIRASKPVPVDSAQGLTTFPCELKPESNDIPKQRQEVLVPGEVLGSVYGENGSNLARPKEITGAYENVKSTLFQVTGKLRQIFFSGRVPEGPDRHCSCQAIPSSSPNGPEGASSTESSQLPRLSHIDQLDQLGSVQKSSSPHSPVLEWDQADSRVSKPMPVDRAQGLTFLCELKPESNVGNDIPEQRVEVLVPRKVFGSVYGENGSNLARIKEISGATVVLQDPCPGESMGKVIICGTSERIVIAQSLLQAFISF